MPGQDKEKLLQLLQLIQSEIERDEALRQQYEVGDKFRFVREQLKNLLEQLNHALEEDVPKEKAKLSVISSDEVPVYVYLFNANGAILRSWQNMLTPKVFYEYSVNRPIYSEQSYIEALLKTKKIKAQHAYLTIAVKAQSIFKTEAIDINDNPLIRVKEGSLHFEKLMAFTHNDHHYQLNDNGELIKQE